jgi:hypothetical protein
MDLNNYFVLVFVIFLNNFNHLNSPTIQKSAVSNLLFNYEQSSLSQLRAFIFQKWTKTLISSIAKEDKRVFLKIDRPKFKKVISERQSKNVDVFISLQKSIQISL